MFHGGVLLRGIALTGQNAAFGGQTVTLRQSGIALCRRAFRHVQRDIPFHPMLRAVFDCLPGDTPRRVALCPQDIFFQFIRHCLPPPIFPAANRFARLLALYPG